MHKTRTNAGAKRLPVFVRGRVKDGRTKWRRRIVLEPMAALDAGSGKQGAGSRGFCRVITGFLEKGGFLFFRNLL